MTDFNELKSLSRKCYKENGYLAILIFIFVGIILGAFFLLDMFLPGLFLILIPVIILPLLFAFYYSIIALRDSPILSINLFFKGFTAYFSERFRSTFNVISALIRGIIFNLVISILLSIIINLSFYFNNVMNYQDFFSGLTALRTIGDAEEFMEAYKDLVLLIRMSTYLPAMIFSSIYCFYRLSIFSISFFLRVSSFKGSGGYILLLIKRFYKENRKHLFIDYLRLNYPMYILNIVGFIGGALLGFYFFKSADISFCTGIALSTLLSFGVFGSKYFANMEGLYLYYSDDILKSDKKVKQEFCNQLKARFGDNLPEDIKKEIEE